MTYETLSKDLLQSLNQIEACLSKSSGQFMNGNTPTSLDRDYLQTVSEHKLQLSPLTHPRAFAWFGLVCHFNEKAQALWAEVDGMPVKSKYKSTGNAAKAEDDDDLDLFGDIDEEEAAAAKKIKEKAQEQKKKKPKPKAMSLVMLEVKPLDDQINLDTLAAKILEEIQQEGLFWKTEYKKEPVAFGIFKLIIGFSLEDDLVSVDDVVEKIEAFEDFVQSVEIMAFNKI